MRRTAAVPALVGALLLAGCGGRAEQPTTSGSPSTTTPSTTTASTTTPSTTTPSTTGPSASGATALTVELDVDGTGSTVTSTLTCDPPAGEAADPAAACAQGVAVGAAGCEPVPGDAVCTQQSDGPQTATVSGTVAGRSVDARFTRNDGCQISRWDALSALLPTGR